MKNSGRKLLSRSSLMALIFLLVPYQVYSDSLKVEKLVQMLSSTERVDAEAIELGEEFANNRDVLNDLRLALKKEGKAKIATKYFDALSDGKPTIDVLFHLSLAYVDQIEGKTLLVQGALSTKSQRVLDRVLEQDPDNWIAWYLKGINNLYWPDWFRKAKHARTYLEEAVRVYEGDAISSDPENTMYAHGYLALGDAYALLDEPDLAKETWARGRERFPQYEEFTQRLELPREKQHEVVRGIRDVDSSINTDLTFPPESLSRALPVQTLPHLNSLHVESGITTSAVAVSTDAETTYSLTLTGGQLYGPGPLVDQPLAPGSLQNLELGSFLNGSIAPNNNGGGEPNVPGELLQGLIIDGAFSDGTPVNESVDVGYVELMNGKFKLFLAAIQDGPNSGYVKFFVDDYGNWTIHDDIGIDPGFDLGVVKFANFTFSTRPRLIPFSYQTDKNIPGGVDVAGSLKSGSTVAGRLGDGDFDGYLDGTFNAIGRFPLDSIILPGAPFAQTREFVSDIPVLPQQAAYLSMANGLSHQWYVLNFEDLSSEEVMQMKKSFEDRWAEAAIHLENAKGWIAELGEDESETINRLLNYQSSVDAVDLCAGIALVREMGAILDVETQPNQIDSIDNRCETI